MASRLATNHPASSDSDRDNAPVVLVADDDDWVRERLAESLRGHGYRVLSVADGRALCALIDLWAAGGDEPCSFIISDLSMPGASGIEALARLRAAGLQIPFLLMSGFIGEEEGARARSLGVTSIIDKPFDLTTLSPVIRALTERA